MVRASSGISPGGVWLGERAMRPQMHAERLDFEPRRTWNTFQRKVIADPLRSQQSRTSYTSCSKKLAVLGCALYPCIHKCSDTFLTRRSQTTTHTAKMTAVLCLLNADLRRRHDIAAQLTDLLEDPSNGVHVHRLRQLRLQDRQVRPPYGPKAHQYRRQVWALQGWADLRWVPRRVLPRWVTDLAKSNVYSHRAPVACGGRLWQGCVWS